MDRQVDHRIDRLVLDPVSCLSLWEPCECHCISLFCIGLQGIRAKKRPCSLSLLIENDGKCWLSKAFPNTPLIMSSYILYFDQAMPAFRERLLLLPAWLWAHQDEKPCCYPRLIYPWLKPFQKSRDSAKVKLEWTKYIRNCVITSQVKYRYFKDFCMEYINSNLQMSIPSNPPPLKKYVFQFRGGCLFTKSPSNVIRAHNTSLNGRNTQFWRWGYCRNNGLNQQSAVVQNRSADKQKEKVEHWMRYICNALISIQSYVSFQYLWPLMSTKFSKMSS